jgi:hypothetical protein
MKISGMFLTLMVVLVVAMATATQTLHFTKEIEELFVQGTNSVHYGGKFNREGE